MHLSLRPRALDRRGERESRPDRRPTTSLTRGVGRVALGGRDRQPLDELARSVGQADTYAVDLLDAEAAHAWAADVVRRHGRVDGLVHLVGGWRGGTPIEEAPLEDWDFLHGLLVRTVQHATQAFAPAP